MPRLSCLGLLLGMLVMAVLLSYSPTAFYAPRPGPPGGGDDGFSTDRLGCSAERPPPGDGGGVGFSRLGCESESRPGPAGVGVGVFSGADRSASALTTSAIFIVYLLRVVGCYSVRSDATRRCSHDCERPSPSTVAACARRARLAGRNKR